MNSRFNFQVRIGDKDLELAAPRGDFWGGEDFNNRVTGMDLDQPLEWMRHATHTATITLNNFDGALTPADGGGTGTYADVNWFEKGVFVFLTLPWGWDPVTGNADGVTEYVCLYAGIITGFDLVDDGTTSYVTVTAIDGISWAGRGTPVAVGGSTDWPMYSALDQVCDLTYTNGTQAGVIPPLGLDGADIDIDLTTSIYNAGAYTDVVMNSRNYDLTQRVLDLIPNQIMSAGVSAMWPTRITTYYSDGLPGYVAGYRACLIDPNLRRVNSGYSDQEYHDKKDYVFVDGGRSSGELEFAQMEVGYNNDSLLTVATVTTSETGNTTEVVNQTAADKYGRLAISLNETVIETDAMAQITAESLTNRFGRVLWAPKKLTFSSALWESYDTETDADTMVKLFDNGSGLGQYCTVTYTPTGASAEVTTKCIIFGRQIRATPNYFDLELTLVPAQPFLPFILDSAEFGVLDDNHLL